MTTAAEYACLASYSEQMFSPGALSPVMDPRMRDWKIIGYMTALNALLGTQRIGFGERIYYGFLAQSISHPDQYVAVIRGTEQAIEWLENIEDFLVPGPPIGQVEHGFWSIYESMRFSTLPDGNYGILAAQGIASMLPAGAALTVVGHSLGAALATYLMADLARIPFKTGQREFTVGGELFASPRTGDEHFVRDVDAVVGKLNYTVYNYIRDIVPHVPPSLPFGLGFQDLPGVVWIKPVTAQAVIANNPACNHSAQSYAAMLDYASTDTMELTNQRCILRSTTP